MAPATSQKPRQEEAEDEVQASLSVLRPLQPLLAGFNHRNRNQHRLARWWGAFGMLRRSAGRLVGALEREASSAGSRAKARRKKERSRKGDGGGDNDDGTEAEVVARWMRDVLIPECYVAFSQLAADNQFATLGIVLLGVLASVRAACVRLVGEPPLQAPEAEGPAGEKKEKSTPATAITAGAAMTAGGGRGGGLLPLPDLGEVVSRKEVAVAAAARGPVAKKRKPSPAVAGTRVEPSRGRGGERQWEKIGHTVDDGDSDDGNDNAVQQGRDESPPTKRKKQQPPPLACTSDGGEDDDDNFFARGSDKVPAATTTAGTSISSSGTPGPRGKKGVVASQSDGGSKRSKEESEARKKTSLSSDKVPEEKAKRKKKKKKGDEFDALFSSLA